MECVMNGAIMDSRHVVYVAALAALTVPYAAQADGPEGIVAVGGISDQTGSLASWGTQAVLATELGVADFNRYLERTGAGWRLEVEFRDSETDPQRAVQHIRDFHSRGINLILGPLARADAQAAAEYAEANDMLLFSCCAADPGPAVVGLYPGAASQGEALGRLMTGEGMRAVIPVYRGDSYGDVVVDAAARSFASAGGDVYEGVRYAETVQWACPLGWPCVAGPRMMPAETSRDFGSAVYRLSDMVRDATARYGADNVGVLLVSFDDGLKIILLASYEQELRQVRWFGDESLTRAASVVRAPAAASFLEDTGYMSVQVAESLNKKHDRVEKYLGDRLGGDPGAFAYAAYDMVWLLGLSVVESGTTDSAGVTRAVPAVADAYRGATGATLLRNAAGDPATPDYSVWGVRNGQWERLAKYHSANQTLGPALPRVVSIPAASALSGDLWPMGQEAVPGMLLGVADFNRYLQGMAADWRLDIAVADTGTDPTRYLKFLQGITAQDRGITMGCVSSASLAMSQDHIRRHGMASVSACSTSPILAVPDGIFRLLPDDRSEADLLARMISDAGAKAVAFLVRNDTWGSGMMGALSAALEDTPHRAVAYAPGGGYGAPVDELAGAVRGYAESYGADSTVVVLLGLAETADVMVSASRHDILGHVRWFGSNGDARSPAVVADPDAFRFARMVSYVAPSDVDYAAPARLQQGLDYPGPLTGHTADLLRIDRHVSRTIGGPTATPAGPLGYDMAWLAGLTVMRTGSADPAAFAQAFPDVARGHLGATGHAVLNDNGDRAHAWYDIWAVGDGGWVQLGRYDGATDMLLSMEDMRR